MGVGVFVTGLSQISSFFLYINQYRTDGQSKTHFIICDLTLLNATILIPMKGPIIIFVSCNNKILQKPRYQLE